jgi:hypothetical protein
MDKLSDLPTEETEMTPQETEVMDNVFGSGDSPKKKDSKPSGWLATLKLAGIASLLFMVLANSWIDVILCRLPYCGENQLTITMIKTVIFMILFIVMYRYLL